MAHQTKQATLLQDTDELCITCRGRGFTSHQEYVGHSYQITTVTARCYMCHGAGCKTVTLFGSLSREEPVLDDAVIYEDHASLQQDVAAEINFLTKWRV